MSVSLISASPRSLLYLARRRAACQDVLKGSPEDSPLIRWRDRLGVDSKKKQKIRVSFPIVFTVGSREQGVFKDTAQDVNALISTDLKWMLIEVAGVWT